MRRWRTLRSVQRHRIRIDDAEPITGIGAIHAEQAAVFAALEVNKPSLNADSPKQLNLV